MNNPESDEPELEDIEDALVGTSDLLAAAALLDHVNAADAVADLYRMLRVVLEHERKMAMLLHRQPAMAERLADDIDSFADVLERVLPPTPLEDE